MSVDGLDHVRDMWASDGASAGLGIELQDVGLRDGLGFARTTMTVSAAQVNGHGICHGGFLFTLADSTFALACNASGSLTVASGATIDFITSARLGDHLEAVAVETARFGRSGLTDATITRDDGELIAHFRGRSRSIARTAGGAAGPANPPGPPAPTHSLDPHSRLDKETS
ncbi:hydroxyphenylacetyl-CoA thioesterase PaaI [Calidifontibacter terrae]